MISILSGSSGFIGKHLEKRLKFLDIEVITLSHGKEKELPKEFTYFFHLASYGNHANQNDEDLTIFSNIIETQDYLSLCKDTPYEKFIYFSTSSVTLPIQTYYSASKEATERICKAHSQKYTKPIVVIRPYSVYGIGEADHRFIPTVIRCLKSGEQMPIDEYAVHDWIETEDFLDALFIILDKGTEFIYEIGTGIQTSNLDVVYLLEEISGKKLNYRKIDGMRPYDTDQWKCDTRKIQELGWRQKKSLREGLMEVWKNE